MRYTSIGLTVVVCLALFLVMLPVKKLTMKIGGYFMAQQKSLADLNGYVEEMVNGQKVVKVFCHEQPELSRSDPAQPHLGAQCRKCKWLGQRA